MSKANDDILTPDEKEFRKILTFINNCREKQMIATPEYLKDNFAYDVLQDVRRLIELELVEYNKKRECYYIKNAGIEALETIYNPEWRRQQEKEKQEAKEAEERRHPEILAEQIKGNRRQRIGIIIVGVIGSVGLIIALLK